MPNNHSNYPLVSVIVNCYNGETYLRDSIKSILDQSYKNFEIIFWDNQSNDQSANIFKSFKDNRLKYYYAKRHTSLYEARNLAIKKSQGEYIAFLDVDDLWTKNKLSLQIKKFKDDKIFLVYSNYFILNQVTGLKKIFYKKKLPEGIIYKELLNFYFLGLGTVVIRKDFLKKKNKIFNKQYNIIGDFDFFIKSSRYFHFSCIQTPLLIYRVHKNSFSNKNYKMHINELKIWLKKQKMFDHEMLYFIEQKVFYMEAILYIFKKKYILSLKKIFKIHSLIKKINIIIFLLIPNFIFKKLKTNFS
jgi:glycosyltransferase involved in cell wall biosynthesis